YRHALDISGNSLAFGSTTGNVYISEDRGESWHAIGNNFPPVHSVRFATQDVPRQPTDKGIGARRVSGGTATKKAAKPGKKSTPAKKPAAKAKKAKASSTKTATKST